MIKTDEYGTCKFRDDAHSEQKYEIYETVSNSKAICMSEQKLCCWILFHDEAHSEQKYEI